MTRDACLGVLSVPLGLGIFLLGFLTAYALLESYNIRTINAEHPLQLVGQPGETIQLKLYTTGSHGGSWNSSDGVYIKASDPTNQFMTTITVLRPAEFIGSSNLIEFVTVEGSLRVPEVPGEGIYNLSGALRGDLNFSYRPDHREPAIWTQYLIDVPVELQILPPGDFNTTVKEQRRKLQWLWGIYFAYLAVFATVVFFVINFFNSRSREDKPPVDNT